MCAPFEKLQAREQSMTVVLCLNQPLIDDGPKQVGDALHCASTRKGGRKTACLPDGKLSYSSGLCLFCKLCFAVSGGDPGLSLPFAGSWFCFCQ
jgi:hypothetical protein